MRRYIIGILLVTTFLPCTARDIYNINRNWKFFTGRETSSDNARTVALPHTWNMDATAGNEDYYRGTGNYLKEIDIPSGWAGRRVFLKGYGANSTATVFINGKFAGEHRGGHTAFCIEITGLLRTGNKNYFRIMVNNSPTLDVLPIAGDMNTYGGLFRDVELIVAGNEVITPDDHASDGVYIRQKKVGRDRVEAEAVVKVSAREDTGGLQAQIAVISDKGDTVAVNKAAVRPVNRAATVSIPFSLDGPRLWNGVQDPYLYRIAVTLHKGKAEVDKVTVTTGFRTFSADPSQGFMLNGEPYRLHGVVAHQDRPITANALSETQVEEDIMLIRKMGANAVRLEGVAHHPAFYDLCDRLGIIVWSDFPLTGEAYLTDKAYVDTAPFHTNGIAQAKDVIRQQYNHPSVAIWGIFSNMSLRDDNPLPYIKTLNALAKNEDPARLTAASSNEDGDINFITDLICWNHHFGWREGQPGDMAAWKRSYQANWKALRSAVSYGAGASIFHQSGEPLARPRYDGNWHPERWQTHLHETCYGILSDDPMFWGIFVSNMFDYGAAGREWGESKGVNDMGLVTYNRKDCKDAYYFYKAVWSDDPFVYIAERRWNKRTRTGQTIKIYTNCGEAELFVNGISKGRKQTDNGILTWNDVQLREGVNIIEARAGDLKDHTRMEIRAHEPGQRIL